MKVVDFKTMDGPIIILTCDRHYLLPTLVLFRNLTLTSQNAYKIEIWLSFDIDNTLAKKFSHLINLINKKFEVSFHKQTPISAPKYDYLTIGAWTRLEAFSKNRKFDSLLLYLDTDIYLEKDWEQIFRQLPNNYFGLAAVKTTGHEKFEKKFPSKDLSEYYFNSGVLIVNSSWWKERGFNFEWHKVLSQYNNLQLTVLDQDVINYLVRGDYFRIRSEFNAYPLSVTNQTKIVHFAGVKKPWGFFNQLKNKSNSLILKEIIKTYQINFLKTLQLIIFKKPIFTLHLIIKFYSRFTIMNIKNLILSNPSLSKIIRKMREYR
jgi:lipopolysaccharide biosynthesis glycosyltransferase